VKINLNQETKKKPRPKKEKVVKPLVNPEEKEGDSPK